MGNFVKRIFAVLAAALTLAACIPVTSKSPVGSTAGLKPDPALYGMWEVRTSAAQYGNPAEDAKERAFIAILPDKGGDVTAVFLDIPSAEKSGEWSSYILTTTTLGAFHYINARALITDGTPADGRETKDSFPILYRIDRDGALTLTLIDEDAAKAAVQSGKIAGRIENGKFGDVTLTAAPAQLDAFFSSDAGRALFTKPLIVLRKVR
jgi:hypothetical protein